MTAFIASLFFVTLAEMGDKTQLLAMAFAARFPARIVLGAVFVATLTNHALAVATGQLLTAVIPLNLIALLAALSFILFGLWTMRGDSLEGEDERPNVCGPFVTVAVAFFLAEIGDKTQLATISLAIEYRAPAAVLLGTTTGMIVADGTGILVGAALGRRLPEAAIRLASAAVFIVFGLFGVGAVLRVWMPHSAVVSVLFLMIVGTLVASHALLLARGRPEASSSVAIGSAPRRVSQILFVGLIAAGWAASLDLVAPLDYVDHWVGFALLAALGWKLIHGAVRVGQSPRLVGRRTAGFIVGLAGLTFVDVMLPGTRLPGLVVPVSILAAAVLVVIAAPAIARRTQGRMIRRIADARITIASGLLLLAIAAQVLIDHVP